MARTLCASRLRALISVFDVVNGTVGVVAMRYSRTFSFAPARKSLKLVCHSVHAYVSGGWVDVEHIEIDRDIRRRLRVAQVAPVGNRGLTDRLNG